MVNKSPKIPHSATVKTEENGKVIQNPHADPDQYQKVITSKRSPLAYHM